MANEAGINEPKLTPEELLGLDEAPRRRRREADEEPAYYDISILKPPVWTPEVAAYFFLGGLSAGAFIIARCAERCASRDCGDITRHGTYISLATALPCAPLLIKDLGDPKRFHHMLRVIKPSSPMNFGTWVVTAFNALAVAAAARELLRAKLGDPPPRGLARLLDWALTTSGDLLGVPVAILLAGYTGVLLSTTSTPVWCKNRWIGALFSASAIGAGASAIRLSTEIKQLSAPAEEIERTGSASHTVGMIETASHIAEAAALAGYLSDAGELAKPLTRGKQSKLFLLGAVGAGLVLPTVLRHAPAPAKWRRWLGIGASVLALAGGAALRWAFVEAGKESGSDPDAARKSSRPGKPEDSLAKRQPSA